MQFPAKKLGFGFMRMPLTDANNQKSIDVAQVEKMVDLLMQSQQAALRADVITNKTRKLFNDIVF